MSSSGRADQVHLAEGRVLEGTATVQGDKVVIEMESGRITVPLREVSQIDRGITPLAELGKREANAKPNDVSALMQLADFARDHDLFNKERELLSRVLTLSTDHSEARRRLGFVREGSKWVDRGELLRREQASRLERRQAQIALEQKQAELELAQSKLRDERAHAAQVAQQAERDEREAARYTPGSYAGYSAYGAFNGYGNYGALTGHGNYGRPGSHARPGYAPSVVYGGVLSPPGGPPSFPIPGVRSPFDTSFSINGVLPPSAYVGGGLRR